MISSKDAEALRHTEYNRDPVVMAMLDTIEELWKRLESCPACELVGDAK